MVRSIAISSEESSEGEYNWTNSSRPATDEEFEQMIKEAEAEYEAGKSMSTEEARAKTNARIEELRKQQELIDWISQLDDQSMLNFLNGLRQSQQEKGQDWWDELTEQEKENIRAGLQDVKEGKTLTSEQFWNQFRNG